jgi:hypothetical protein
VSLIADIPVIVEITRDHCQQVVDIIYRKERVSIDPRWIEAIAIVESSRRATINGQAVTRVEPHQYRQRVRAMLAAMAKPSGLDELQAAFADRSKEIEALGKFENRFLGIRGQNDARNWLARALVLTPEAAAASCSYGAWQIMGFNHKLCGSASPRALLDQMDKGPEQQAVLLANFLIAQRRTLDAIYNGNVAAFAVQYNGSGLGNMVDGKPNPNSDYSRKLRAALVKTGGKIA